MSRSEGVWGEALVADYLREKGYKLAAHSYRCRFGEIDLIAWDKSVLCGLDCPARFDVAEVYAAAPGDEKSVRIVYVEDAFQ